MLRIINFGGLSILAFLFISENLKESYLTGIWLKCRKRVKEKSTGQLVPQGLEKKKKTTQNVCLLVFLSLQLNWND